jgi:signal transduction histidine kinase
LRTVLRELALRIVLAVGATVVVVAAVVSWIFVELRGGPYEDSRTPLWLLVGTVLGGSLLTVAVVVPVVRAFVDRAAETIADPLRRLAHRTDEMASGGFALDPQTRPGRVVQPDPWRAGIREIDAVAREIDRHHSTFARALVSERSFASDASHQLRTPLAALLLRLEEIAQSQDAAEARAEAEIAIGQVERLTGVVDELLRRTRAGHATGGALSAVDQVLAGLDEEWTPSFTERGRSIKLTCERGIIVEASASALSQVLNTLVENALVHGGGRVDVHVSRSGPSAVFRVSDQGRGIPEYLARTVFDRAVTTGEGTGLGLAVARETAETIGGRLELTQVRPPVFSLYLPLAQTP